MKFVVAPPLLTLILPLLTLPRGIPVVPNLQMNMFAQAGPEPQKLRFETPGEGGVIRPDRKPSSAGPGDRRQVADDAVVVLRRERGRPWVGEGPTVASAP